MHIIESKRHTFELEVNLVSPDCHAFIFPAQRQLLLPVSYEPSRTYSMHMPDYLYKYMCSGLFLHNKVHSSHTTPQLRFPTTVNSHDPSKLVHIYWSHPLYRGYYFSLLPKDTKVPKDTRLLLLQTILWSGFLDDLLSGTESMRLWGWTLPGGDGPCSGDGPCLEDPPFSS